MPRVLIVEDDTVMANAMATHLRHAGMAVEWSDRGDRAMKRLRFERPDVAIIDLMLPGMDGWRMIEALRADGVGIPLIVVSARGTEQDKVHALGIGGDDYLAKPFGHAGAGCPGEGGDPPRRHPPGERRAQEGGGARPADRSRPAPGDARRRGRGADANRVPAAVGARVRARPRDDSRPAAAAGVGTPHRPRDRSVDVCVRNLREKLDQRSTAFTFIHTHYGVGYRFDAEPRRAEVET